MLDLFQCIKLKLQSDSLPNNQIFTQSICLRCATKITLCTSLRQKKLCPLTYFEQKFVVYLCNFFCQTKKAKKKAKKGKKKKWSHNTNNVHVVGSR